MACLRQFHWYLFSKHEHFVSNEINETVSPLQWLSWYKQGHITIYHLYTQLHLVWPKSYRQNYCCCTQVNWTIAKLKLTSWLFSLNCTVFTIRQCVKVCPQPDVTTYSLCASTVNYCIPNSFTKYIIMIISRFCYQYNIVYILFWMIIILF